MTWKFSIKEKKYDQINHPSQNKKRILRTLQMQMQRNPHSIPDRIVKRPEPQNAPVQLLHRHGTKRTRHTPGGILTKEKK